LNAGHDSSGVWSIVKANLTNLVHGFELAAPAETA
jgi:hypothetical protein